MYRVSYSCGINNTFLGFSFLRLPSLVVDITYNRFPIFALIVFNGFIINSRYTNLLCIGPLELLLNACASQGGCLSCFRDSSFYL